MADRELFHARRKNATSSPSSHAVRAWRCPLLPLNPEILWRGFDRCRASPEGIECAFGQSRPTSGPKGTGFYLGVFFDNLGKSIFTAPTSNATQGNVRFGPLADILRSSICRLLDYFVGARKQRRRHGDAERFRRREIDYQIKLSW